MVPVHLLPAEIKHPEVAQAWALAGIRFNAGVLAKTDPYGGDESGIRGDTLWFVHYLVALARLTDEGRAKVLAARGPR